MPIPVGSAESKEPPRTESAPKKWISKVEKRYKDLCKDWLDDAKKVEKIYEAKDPVQHPFNILYSNTQTLLPALYNSTPRAEVSRRHTQVDPQQKSIDSAVSQVVERFLEYTADTNNEEYEEYSDATRYAVESALVPGLGCVRARLKQEGGYQQVCFESVQFDRFVWQKSRTWSRVAWVAFGHDLGKADFEAAYPEFCKKKEYKSFEWEKLEKDNWEDADKPERPAGSAPALLIWEVWDYASKKILHVCNQWKDEELLEEDYPPLLTSRFPCPKPLMYAKKLRDFLPIPPYQMYQQQAEELNRITGRIIRLVRAIKAKGVYNSTNPELQQLFENDDDTILVPSESSAAFQDGMAKSIWFMPVEELVRALQQLYVAQQNCLQTIYQIMGLSDIQRGATDPNETAKAQEIKNSWGGLRTKMSQKTVQIFCRDLFRVAVELAASYFTPATWSACTKVPLLFEQQKQQYGLAMQQFQGTMAQYQQMAQQAQAAGQQPPPPPQPPLSQLQQAMLARPTWEQVIQIVQDNFERTYRIDVETNSTVDLEATEDKQAIAEFMNAFGQMTAGLENLIASGSLPFEASKVLLMEVTRRFRFGRRVEAVLEQMQQPQPQGQEDQKAALERVRAEGAKRLLEAEQTITSQNEETERLKTENFALKTMQGAAEKEQKATMKEQLGQVKSDYQGKLMLQAKQNLAKETEVLRREAGVTLEEMAGGLIKQLRDAQMELQGQMAEMRAAASAATKPVMDESRFLQMMQEQQATFLQAMQMMAQLMTAPRVTSLERDPKTGKPVASRSQIVLQ